MAIRQLTVILLQRRLILSMVLRPARLNVKKSEDEVFPDQELTLSSVIIRKNISLALGIGARQSSLLEPWHRPAIFDDPESGYQAP